MGLPKSIVGRARKELGPRETIRAGLRGYYHVMNNLAVGFVAKYESEIRALPPGEAKRVLPEAIFQEAQRKGLMSNERA